MYNFSLAILRGDRVGCVPFPGKPGYRQTVPNHAAPRPPSSSLLRVGIPPALPDRVGKRRPRRSAGDRSAACGGQRDLADDRAPGGAGAGGRRACGAACGAWRLRARRRGRDPARAVCRGQPAVGAGGARGAGGRGRGGGRGIRRIGVRRARRRRGGRGGTALASGGRVRRGDRDVAARCRVLPCAERIRRGGISVRGGGPGAFGIAGAVGGGGQPDGGSSRGRRVAGGWAPAPGVFRGPGGHVANAGAWRGRGVRLARGIGRQRAQAPVAAACWRTVALANRMARVRGR